MLKMPDVDHVPAGALLFWYVLVPANAAGTTTTSTMKAIIETTALLYFKSTSYRVVSLLDA
jgi:hypothetical protein